LTKGSKGSHFTLILRIHARTVNHGRCLDNERKKRENHDEKERGKAEKREI